MDIAFYNQNNNNNSNNNNGYNKTNVYISSNRGIVLCINSLTDQIICAYQLHTLSIRSITTHSGYTVTGSDDNKLRLWPIDFTDYLLESQHEGCISNIRISNNGRKLAVGTLSGTLGILNISEHSYSTVLRSHIGSVIQVIPRIKGMINNVLCMMYDVYDVIYNAFINDVMFYDG
jgi:WD40 repeat protein